MSISKADMSELPPIGARPGSSKSRRSSRDSSSGGYGAKNNNTMKYEKQALLSVDSNPNLLENMSMNARAVKRSHVSPGSNGSSSPSFQGGVPVIGGMSRAKSWCATEANSGPNPKLETLFERNGVISHGQGNRIQNKINHVPNSGQVISDERNTVSNKPPRARLRSDGGANGTTIQNSRRSLSNSITNLSGKPADVSAVETPRFAKNSTTNGMTPRNKTSLYRAHQFRSEQNLLHSSNNNPGNTTARGNRPRLSTARAQEQNSTNAANFRQASKNVRANSAYPKAKEPAEPTLTPQNIRNIENSAKSDDSDNGSDPKYNERIVQWLQGLDAADAPEDPEIEHQEEVVEQPKQTDTAIHIVYNED